MERPPLPANVTVPDGVQYDGAISAPGLGRTLLCFTDIQAGPSKGASFSVDRQYLTSATIARKLREVRHAFRIGSVVKPRPAICA